MFNSHPPRLNIRTRRQQSTSSDSSSSSEEDHLSNQEKSHDSLTSSEESIGSPVEESEQEDALARLKKLLDTVGDKHKSDDDDQVKKQLERKRKRLELEWDVKSFEYQHQTLADKLQLQRDRDFLRLNNEIQELEQRNKKQKMDPDLELKKQQAQSELDYLRLQINRKEREQEWKDWVDGQPEYLMDPVRRDPQTGEVEIVMSDRVIELDEVITYRTADKVTERIHYFNNQSDQLPIFLVIDYSLGGSVIAGYRIQKAMDASPAPIYVIVKSFAASMAASIASMATHSFIYPNGILMHHQIICGYRGNLTQLEEGVAELREWWRRLAGPLAKKLGISLDEWIKRMYEHNSDGDWEEFGDKAVKLGWVDSLVHRLRQTGHLRHPDWKLREDNFFRTPFLPLPFIDRNNQQQQTPYAQQQQTPYAQHQQIPYAHVSNHSQNNRVLPPLKPKDHWWLYNPNGYYRSQ